MLSKQVEIRGSIRYSIQYRIRITEPELSLDNRTQSPDLNQKESWSIDRAETENQSWTQGVSTRKSSWNQFQNHLLKKDQFVNDLFQSSSSTGSTRTRISCSLFRFVCVRTNPDFSVNVSVLITGNEVYVLISYRKSDIWKTRLNRGHHNWPGSGSGSGIWY